MNALVIVSADLFGIGIASGHPVSRSMMVRICLFPLLDSVKSVTRSITILSKGWSQSNEISEDNSVNPTLAVEVIPLRRSARERKQTQLFGNPWLYKITYNLTSRLLSDLLHHVPDTKDSLADVNDTLEL